MPPPRTPPLRRALWLLLTCLSLGGASPAPVPAPDIVERPLPWGDEKRDLTVAYLGAHRTAPLHGDPELDTHMVPRVVVLHWTAGGSAQSAWNTFAAPRLAGRPELRKGGDLNVGAHYVVDRDGTIWRLAPDERVLRHCVGLNHIAIGVENVGGQAGMPLTPAQVKADAALVRWLASVHPITHLIGHLEYQSLEGHSYFEEKDPTYRTKKPDPGAPFMAAVRAELADLGLLGSPPKAPKPAPTPRGAPNAQFTVP